MKGKISDVMLGMIGALSARWPAADTGDVWAKLHEAIADCRQWVRNVDVELSTIEADRNLSELGRFRKGAEYAVTVIGLLNNSSDVAKAEEAVEKQFAEIAKGSKLPVAPESVAEVALAAEIRAHVARQQEPHIAVHKLAGDPRVVAAVMHAPAFLSGLTDEQKNRFLAQAEISLFPEGTGDRQKLEAALKVLRDAVGAAERKIAERARLHRTPTGWQVPPAVQKAA
jgi:hypothetical protein